MKNFITNSRALFLFCMLAVMTTNNVAAETNSTSSQIRDHRKAPSKGVVRDHRRSEAPISLKANQRLMLTNGKYIVRLTNGTVNILEMNGRVVRPFPRGKIVKDKRGGITIISGQQRVQAGVFKSFGAAVQRRDHRKAPSKGEVRDHRQSEPPINLKANQRLMLTNGKYIERLTNGTVNILEMNGRVVRPFPRGMIVKDKRGGITIISGKQQVKAGMFKAIKTFRTTQLSQ